MSSLSIKRKDYAELERALDDYGAIHITEDGTKYGFFPYWVEMPDEESDDIILHPLAKPLPEKLRLELEELRKKRKEM